MSSAPVRSMTVVMLDVDAQHRLQVTSPEDEDAVQALTPERADEPLGECLRFRRPDRSADDSRALGRKHLIDRTAELAVALMGEKPERLCSFVEVEVKFLACWVTQAPSGLVVQPARWTRLVASSMNTRT